MAIQFECECGKILKARDDLAGRKTRCPGCSKILDIPHPEPEIEDAEDAAYALLEPDPTPQQEPEVPTYHIPATAEDEEAARPARMGSPSTFHTAAPSRSSESRVVPHMNPEWPVASSASILEYSYILLIFALLPLVFTLLAKREHVTLEDRIEATMESITNDDDYKRVDAVLSRDEVTEEEAINAMPGHRLLGAHLSRDSILHWVYAGIAAIGFLLILMLFFSVERANPLHLLAVGLFTGTLGIFFLLAVQWCSQVRIGRIRGNAIIIAIILFLWFVGWSYHSALDPESNFFLSAVGFTFGVGLCEEATKMIPLLFFLKRDARMGWRGAALWGLASGIGFGVSEGVTYAGDMYNGIHGGNIYLVRFVSCVALHAMWSAMAAIAIARNIDWYESVEDLGGFVVFTFRVLAVPMVLHGFYDTLLKMDMDVGALIIAFASFAWLAIQIERAKGAHPHPGPVNVKRRHAY